MGSCSDDFTDWANPQSNEQEDAVTIPGFKASQAADIDLAAVTDSAVTFTLSTATLPDGFSLGNARIELTPEGQTQATTFAASTDGKVTKAELQTLIESIYGKRPAKRTFTGHVYVNAVKDGEAALIDAGEIKVNITPEAPFIDAAYYLVGDMFNVKEGDKTVVDGWSKKGAKGFMHSGKDVYEDPVFTITFTTTAPNQYWKIIPKTNYDGDFWAGGRTGVVGPKTDGATDMQGELTNDKPQAGKIEEPGTYVMTLDMMSYTYTLQKVLPKFYIFGDLGGWNADAAVKQFMTPGDNNTYSYTTRFNGNVKVWGANDLGNWDKCWNTSSANNGSTALTGPMEQSNGGAIHSPENALFTFTMDLNNMTYTWTKLADQSPKEYQEIGIVGEFNEWKNDVMLKEVAPHNWYVVTTVTSGSLKFRADHDWKNSWGANLTVSDANFHAIGITDNGPNIYVPAGTYAFYLNDITNAIAIVAQ